MAAHGLHAYGLVVRAALQPVEPAQGQRLSVTTVVGVKPQVILVGTGQVSDQRAMIQPKVTQGVAPRLEAREPGVKQHPPVLGHRQPDIFGEQLQASSIPGGA